MFFSYNIVHILYQVSLKFFLVSSGVNFSIYLGLFLLIGSPHLSRGPQLSVYT